MSVCVCVCVYAYEYEYVYEYVCVRVCVCMCMCVCERVCRRHRQIGYIQPLNTRSRGASKASSKRRPQSVPGSQGRGRIRRDHLVSNLRDATTRSRKR